MKLLTTLLAGAVASGLFAAPAPAAESATLMLNWFPLADHSPIYLAKKKGYYQEEGIDLKIVRGFGSGDTAKAIDLGQAEFGISDTPTVLTAISKGADIRIIGIVFDKAANNAFFYKDAGIKTPQDLAGKKVATPPGDSHRFLWPALAKINGVDPDSLTFVNVKPEGKQGIVASKNVDAAFDLYTSYPIWEKALGKGNVGNLLFADHGVALYGHAYIAANKLIKDKPALVKGFLKATYEGWRDAYTDRDGAIDALAAEVPGVDRDAYRASLDYVLDLAVTERSREHGLGWIVPERMQQTIDITKQGGTLDKPLDASAVYTNELNPKIPPPDKAG